MNREEAIKLITLWATCGIDQVSTDMLEDTLKLGVALGLLGLVVKE